MPNVTTILPGHENRPETADPVSSDALQLLVFSATWCGPCRAMAPAIDDIAQDYASDLVVVKIDIETSPDLAKEFDVRGVPTVITRCGAAIIDRHVGGMTRTRLALMIEDALKRGNAAE
ncbi:thioredoxin 1 [Sphingomonas sp. SORGH_AS870]|nr:thioredoxin 1 [Sphingomonas sp. SORGH_AS_0870]